MLKKLPAIWRALCRTVLFIGRHPLTRRHRIRAYRRYGWWQTHGRFRRRPAVFPFVNGSQLSIPVGAHGLTGYLYVGLPDFEESAFALHLLRPGDRFVDVGANAGAWTVMAAAVGAEIDAFEPIADSRRLLEENVALNALQKRVHIHATGVGSQPGRLRFTSGCGTSNHVVSTEDREASTVEVPIVTLDQACAEHPPVLIKIDVEGWELEVIKGMETVLKQPALLGLIVETFRHSRLEEPGLREMEAILGRHGFQPGSYDPRERKLVSLETEIDPSDNTIYARQLPVVNKRLREAEPFSIFGQRI